VPVATTTLALGVELVRDQAVAARSIDKDVKPVLDQTIATDFLAQAHEAALKNDEKKVLFAFDELKKRVGRQFEYRDQTGAVQSMSVEECRKGMLERAQATAAPGMNSADCERWAKEAKAATTVK
jgi:hypothetical protein